MADEHIKVKLRQLSPYPLDEVLPVDGIYVWEEATGLLRQANVSQLPNNGGGSGSGGTLVGSPFKARLGDDNVEVVSDGAGGFNTVITDARLLGKTDYPVNSSQLNNGVYRDNEVEYDADAGSVTILGLMLLDGEVVVLFPDGVQAPATGIDALLTRVQALELMSAPFVPGLTGSSAARVWWRGSADSIPTGWIEDTDMQGRFPIGIDPGVPAYNDHTKIGGSMSATLSEANIPEHSHQTVIDEDINSDQFPYASGRSITNLKAMVRSWFKNSGGGREAYYLSSTTNDSQPTLSPTSKYGSATPTPISTINRFAAGRWIKYVGI